MPDNTPQSPATPEAAATNAGMAPIVERLAESAHRAIDQLAGSAGPAVERLRGSVASTVDNVGRQIDGLGEKREQWLDDGRQSVREHPMLAIGAAFLAGAVFALVLRGRD